MKDRDIDIWKLESQEKIRKMYEEWTLSRLGERAKRMMQNAETAGRRANAGDEAASGAEPAEAGGAAGYGPG
jgi:hypothetical protein